MAFKVPEVQMCLGDRVAGRGTVPRNWARHRPAQLRGTVPRSFVRVSVNHQRLVCLENSRIEPTPEQVRPNFWNWKESEGGVQHRFYATSLHAIFLRNRAIFTRSCSTY